MNVEFQKVDDVHGIITVTVGQAEYADTVKKELKNIGKTHAEPGFRAGHVPAGVLEKKYGKIETIEHEIPFTRRKSGQVITGEIDLYVRTESGKGILVDFKNPMTIKDTDDDALKDKAIKYWPQLEAYRDALSESDYPVNQVFIYYPLLGVVAKF